MVINSICNIEINKNHRKYWLKLAIKIISLYFSKRNKQEVIVEKSYNSISTNYDYLWSNHMNKFSKELINKIDFPDKGVSIDLMCGTGYVTGLIAEKFEGKVIGIDISDGMLNVAKKKYNDKYKFIQSDVIKYLESQPSESVDVVVCAWGLGFTKPFKVIKEITRILKPSGQVGIIDNSLLTIYEVVFSGILTIAEYPSAVINKMNVRWLPSKESLTRRMKLSGLKIINSWKGYKTYYAKNGEDAINFLINTGTAAGYQYCINKKYSDVIKKRFGIIFKKSYGTEKGLPITHRYIAAIAKKPN
jgi:ubiquinone/menaquinone biosynthesis C-methylase UbiE